MKVKRLAIFLAGLLATTVGAWKLGHYFLLLAPIGTRTLWITDWMMGVAVEIMAFFFGAVIVLLAQELWSWLRGKDCE